jgi:leucyl aminopeptidase
MQYFTTTSNAARRAVDCVIVGAYERGKLSTGATDIDKASGGELRRLIKSGDISTQPGRCVVLTRVSGIRAPRVAVVGLGKSGELDARKFILAVTTAARSIADTKCSQVLNTLTLDAVVDSDAYYVARYTVQAIGEVLYRFTQLKSGRKPPVMPLKKIGLSISKRGDAARSMLGANHADAIVKGVSLARDLGNLPPNVCTPSHLARTAQKLASGNGKLTTRVLNEAEMKRLGMHSLLSVTAGTAEPAKMIVMQYKGGGRDKPIVLVGAANQRQCRRTCCRKPPGQQGDGAKRYCEEHVGADDRNTEHGCRGPAHSLRRPDLFPPLQTGGYYRRSNTDGGLCHCARSSLHRRHDERRHPCGGNRRLWT